MKNEFSWQKTLLWVSLFSIAMGFFESAVVVYLRTIYFPHGFGFPLAPIDTHIALIELIREASTILMLVSIGFLAGENSARRFAYFIFSFAIWDISYYIFLKIIDYWPDSIMTWDVLFLIPILWTSPVIAPVIASITMIILALLIIIQEGRNNKIIISRAVWFLLIAGSIIIIAAFIWDFSGYMLENNAIDHIWSFNYNQELLKSAINYIPKKFNWFLFSLGEFIILSGIGVTAVKSGIFRKINLIR